jgi:hypothetical protein
MNHNHNLLLAVRELMERNLDAYEIAHRLWIDLSTVQTIIDIIQGTLL